MIKYKYPDEVNTIRDIIIWFDDEYYQKKFGYGYPRYHYGKAGSILKRMENQGYTLDEIMLTVWGCCNTETKVTSLAYCKFYFDKLQQYKQMKEDYEIEKNIEEDEVVDYIHVEENEDKGGSALDELL